MNKFKIGIVLEDKIEWSTIEANYYEMGASGNAYHFKKIVNKQSLDLASYPVLNTIIIKEIR